MKEGSCTKKKFKEIEREIEGNKTSNSYLDKIASSLKFTLGCWQTMLPDSEAEGMEQVFTDQHSVGGVMARFLFDSQELEFCYYASNK